MSAAAVESDVERVASAVIEQALAVVALGGDITEPVAARRLVLGLESGRFVIVEGEAADGGFALSRLFGRSPTARDLAAVQVEALTYARLIVAWHDRATAERA